MGVAARRPRHRALLIAIVTAIVAAAVVVTVQPWRAGSANAVAPHPTRTPETPGLVLASSTTQDLPDGWLMADGKRYLLFLSTSFGNPVDNIPLLTGVPGHWSAATDALPVMPAWASTVAQGGLTWTPTVHRFEGQYVLYYSSRVAGTKMHCIGTATAATPAGPFAPRSPPIVCQRNQQGDTDPQVVPEGSGARLIFKSDNNSAPNSGTDTIWSQPLSPDGLHVTGTPKAIFHEPQAPQAARPIVEAPQMAEYGGTWWLFYSGGQGYASPDYAIYVAKCAGLSGPCTTTTRTPLIASNAQGAGPGEESIYTAGDRSQWVLYSPWNAQIFGRWFRPVEATRIGWTTAGPYVAAAGRFPAPGSGTR